MSAQEPSKLPFFGSVCAGAEVAAVLASFNDELASGIPLVLVTDLGATHLVLDCMDGSGRSSSGVTRWTRRMSTFW